MNSTTLDKIGHEPSFSAIVDAVVAWAEANQRDVKALTQKHMQHGFSKRQALYREVHCDGYHEVFIEDDGMSARFLVRKSYLFFDEVMKQDTFIEVKFQERIVPALPLSYDNKTVYTTVGEATRIRKRIVDMMNQPI